MKGLEICCPYAVFTGHLPGCKYHQNQEDLDRWLSKSPELRTQIVQGEARIGRVRMLCVIKGYCNLGDLCYPATTGNGDCQIQKRMDSDDFIEYWCWVTMRWEWFARDKKDLYGLADFENNGPIDVYAPYFRPGEHQWRGYNGDYDLVTQQAEE